MKKHYDKIQVKKQLVFVIGFYFDTSTEYNEKNVG